MVLPTEGEYRAAMLETVGRIADALEKLASVVAPGHSGGRVEWDPYVRVNHPNERGRT